MKAGQSNLDLGLKVQIQNIKGFDKNLNGLIGIVTHPFAFGETKKGWVGIWLDGSKHNMPYGGQCNVHESECKIL